MTRLEIRLLNNFTEREITKTGARLKDVKFGTMYTLQTVRTKIDRRIKLVKNGITTGKHSADEHPNGKAIDFHLDDRDGIVTFRIAVKVLYAMFEAGFKGIGLYHNGNIYSFHGHIGSTYRTWSTRKVRVRKGKTYRYIWQYSALFTDPQLITPRGQHAKV